MMKLVAILVFGLGLSWNTPALSMQQTSAVVPVAVAESELFEAAGRLETEGLIWFVDRADTNAPVLGAELEIEFAGKTGKAVFRPETGDYLLADPDWLKPLRQPGRHALGLTLVLGEESDLLAAELKVEEIQVAEGNISVSALTIVAFALGLLVLLVIRRRLRQGGLA